VKDHMLSDEQPFHEQPVRRHFDLSASSEPQLELRLHWFGRALEVRQGYIVAVQRRRSGRGKHVASIAYEVPLPEFPRGVARARRGEGEWDATADRP
jgi:hypothetical protein